MLVFGVCGFGCLVCRRSFWCVLGYLGLFDCYVWISLVCCLPRLAVGLVCDLSALLVWVYLGRFGV